MLFLKNSIKKSVFYAENKFEISLALITYFLDASISLHTLV